MPPAREARRTRGMTAGASKPSQDSPFFTPSIRQPSPLRGADEAVSISLAVERAAHTATPSQSRGVSPQLAPFDAFSGACESLGNSGCEGPSRRSSGGESHLERVEKRGARSVGCVSSSVSSCCPSASSHFCPSSASLSSSSQSIDFADSFCHRVFWDSRSAGSTSAVATLGTSGPGPRSAPGGPPPCACSPVLDFHQALAFHADTQLASPQSSLCATSSAAAVAPLASHSQKGDDDAGRGAPQRVVVGTGVSRGGVNARILSGQSGEACAASEAGSEGDTAAAPEPRIQVPETKGDSFGPRAGEETSEAQSRHGEGHQDEASQTLCLSAEATGVSSPQTGVSSAESGDSGKLETGSGAPGASASLEAPRPASDVSLRAPAARSSVSLHAVDAGTGIRGGAPLGKNRARLLLMRHGLAPDPGVSSHPTGSARTANSLRLLRDLQTLPGPHGSHARHLASFLQKHRGIFAPTSLWSTREAPESLHSRRASSHDFLHLCESGLNGDGDTERLILSSSRLGDAPPGVDAARGDEVSGVSPHPFVQWASELLSASSAASLWGPGHRRDPTAPQGPPRPRTGSLPSLGRDERSAGSQGDWPGEGGASSFSSPRQLQSHRKGDGDGGRQAPESASVGDSEVGGKKSSFSGLSPAARRYRARCRLRGLSDDDAPEDAGGGRNRGALPAAGNLDGVLAGEVRSDLSPNWPSNPPSFSATNSPDDSLFSSPESLLRSVVLAASSARDATETPPRSRTSGTEEADDVGPPRDSEVSIGASWGPSGREIPALSGFAPSRSCVGREASGGGGSTGGVRWSQAREAGKAQQGSTDRSGVPLLGVSKVGPTPGISISRVESGGAGGPARDERDSSPTAGLVAEDHLSYPFSRFHTAPHSCPVSSAPDAAAESSPFARLPLPADATVAPHSLCLLLPGALRRGSWRPTGAAPVGPAPGAMPAELMQRRGKSLPPTRSREWRKSRAAVAAILGSTVASWRTSHLARHLGRFPFFAELRDVCHEVYIHSRFGRFYVRAERAPEQRTRKRVHGNGPSVPFAGHSACDKSQGSLNGAPGRGAPKHASPASSPAVHASAGETGLHSPSRGFDHRSSEDTEVPGPAPRARPQTVASVGGGSGVREYCRGGTSAETDLCNEGQGARQGRRGGETRKSAVSWTREGLSEQSSERSSDENWGHGDRDQLTWRRGLRATSHSPHRSARHSDPRPFMSPPRYSLRRKLWRFTNVPADATLVTGPGVEGEEGGSELRSSWRPEERRWRFSRRASGEERAGGREVSPVSAGGRTEGRRSPSARGGRRPSARPSSSDSERETDSRQRAGARARLSRAEVGVKAGRGAGFRRKTGKKQSGSGARGDSERKQGEGPARRGSTRSKPHQGQASFSSEISGAGNCASSLSVSSSISFESVLSLSDAPAPPAREPQQSLSSLSSCSSVLSFSSIGERMQPNRTGSTGPKSPAPSTGRAFGADTKKTEGQRESGRGPVAKAATTPRSHVLRRSAAKEDHGDECFSASGKLSRVCPGLGQRCLSDPAGETLFLQATTSLTPEERAVGAKTCASRLLSHAASQGAAPHGGIEGAPQEDRKFDGEGETRGLRNPCGPKEREERHRQSPSRNIRNDASGGPENKQDLRGNLEESSQETSPRLEQNAGASGAPLASGKPTKGSLRGAPERAGQPGGSSFGLANWGGATQPTTAGAVERAATLTPATFQGETRSLLGPGSPHVAGGLTRGGREKIQSSRDGSEDGWAVCPVAGSGSEDAAKTMWATVCSLRRRSGASWRSPPRRRPCALQKRLAKTQKRDLGAFEGFRRRTLSSDSVGSAGSAESVSSVDSVGGGDGASGWPLAFGLSSSPLSASRAPAGYAAALAPQSLAVDQGPGVRELPSVFSTRSPIHRANTVAFGPEQDEVRLRLDLNTGRLSGCLRDFPQCILEVILSGRGRRARRREKGGDASRVVPGSHGKSGRGTEDTRGDAASGSAFPAGGRPRVPGRQAQTTETGGAPRSTEAGRSSGGEGPSSSITGAASPAKLRHPSGLSSSQNATETRTGVSSQRGTWGPVTPGGGRPRMCLWLGSFSIPRDDKRYRGGEDAWFISSACNAFGVADGVGEWEDLAGINPQSFAQDLMKGSLRHVRRIKKTLWTHQRDAEKRLAKEGGAQKRRDATEEKPFDAAQAATEALSKAYRDAKNYGSSTALVGVLDEDKGILGFANLGDSSGMVLRRLQAHRRTGGTALSVVKRVKGMQHSFNVPYQFAHIPGPEDWERLRATGMHRLVSIAEKEFHQRAEERSSGSGKGGDKDEHSELDSTIGDSPSCIESTTVRVEAGDLIVLGTDGLFDNLFDYEITALSTTVTQAKHTRDLGSFVHGTLSPPWRLEKNSSKRSDQNPRGTGRPESGMESSDGSCPENVFSEEMSRTFLPKEVIHVSRSEEGVLLCADGLSYTVVSVVAARRVGEIQFVLVPEGVLSTVHDSRVARQPHHSVTQDGMGNNVSDGENAQSYPATWDDAIPVSSTPLSGLKHVGQSDERPLLQRGSSVAVLCPGMGAEVVAVPLDYARLFGGDIRGPWSHAVTVAHAWTASAGTEAMDPGPVIRLILSGGRKYDHRETNRKTGVVDSGLVPVGDKVPLLLTLSLESSDNMGSAFEAAALVSSSNLQCMLMGMRYKIRSNVYPVELVCQTRRHSALRPRKLQHRTTDTSSSRSSLLPVRFRRFLHSSMSFLFTAYVVSLVTMFLGHFLTYRSTWPRERLVQSFTERRVSAGRVGLRFIPFIDDQDFLDYHTAQRWENMRRSLDFARRRDLGTGAGFLMAGAGFMGVTVSAELFMVAILLYVLNVPVVSVAKWLKKRRRQKMLRDLEEASLGRQLVRKRSKRSRGCPSTRVVLAFLVDLDRVLGHNE
ncbi:serine/threonine specific protein phosphatase [Toxoplasma gondii VAND]|uniref:Serine/threonine specific protein phosphatase n=1 Tax=Toxoplasma gondii VAND TaxID=933077 RepID=A0A086PQA8_TOXGO|nr:serine/threonine specific protein phosphatase [Toxoplasma gondii VAND]